MRFFEVVKDEEPKTGEGNGAVAAHEAVMPDLHKARGQHMLEEAPHELQGVAREMTQLVAILLAIRESNVSIFDSDDSGVGDCYPEDIGSKVLKGGLTVAYRLTVDVPGHLPDGGIDFMKESPSCHVGFKFCLKDLGKGSDGQVEVIAGCQPLLSVWGEAPGGDNEGSSLGSGHGKDLI